MSVFDRIDAAGWLEELVAERPLELHDCGLALSHARHTIVLGLPVNLREFLGG